MGTESSVDVADRLARRRARILPVFAVIFVAWQANYLALPPESGRAVDHVKIAAWLVWALALLVLLATGGMGFRSREVRALLNDESTRENRRTAYAYGYWAAVGSAVGLYGVGMFEPVSGREAVHVVVTAAVAAALLTFGALERRSLRDG
jgi:hypothetical protein